MILKYICKKPNRGEQFTKGSISSWRPEASYMYLIRGGPSKTYEHELRVNRHRLVTSPNLGELHNTLHLQF
jgi:hypothetical protein